jgi:hypothetical protein
MHDEVSDGLVDYLRKDDNGRKDLDELVQLFCEMISNNEFKFPMLCFYETRTTDFTKVLRKLPPEFAREVDSAKSGIVSPRIIMNVLQTLIQVACSTTFSLPPGCTPLRAQC